MSKPINDDGPAFPHDAIYGNPRGFAEPDEGLSIRDYFAAHIIGGWCAGHFLEPERSPELARLAYDMADAMLRERAKGTEVKA